MLLAIAWGLAVAAGGGVLAVAVAILLCRRSLFRYRTNAGRNTLSIGFFHPYCNSGGGGERVLWQGLHALMSLGDTDSGTNFEFIVYSGDPDITLDDAKRRAEDRFGITLAAPKNVQLKFVYVSKRYLLEGQRYPRFTMLGQSLGSMVLAWECVRAYTPDVFFDTTGWAFTYFVAKLLARCRVAAYTHYPTITTDMLNKVHERRPTYNNDAAVSSSGWKTSVKVIYYRLFAVLYGWMGRFVDVSMVNSTWTKNHIVRLWGSGLGTTVVYPPCNTAALASDNADRTRTVLSVAQFRPEKDHALQLRAFKAFKDMGDQFDDVRLVMVGGCRSDDDRALVDALKKTAAELGIQDSVDFRINVPFSELKALLRNSLVGIHTMWNEHFGIGVVEMMAAGCITIAHNSGGPKSDIVVDHEGEETGFLASNPTQYAAALSCVFDGQVDVNAMRAAARASVANRFSDEQFALRFFAQVVGLAQDIIHDKQSGKIKTQ